MVIALLGYRGSGKTTVGQGVARELGLPFVDTDVEVVAAAGKSIREIFAEGGEASFRKLESAAVATALHRLNPTSGVVSLGGGAVLSPVNRDALRAGAEHRIYLHCSPEVLHTRIHGDATTAANRPALTHLGGSLAEINQLLALREPIYRDVATSEIDVTERSVDAIVSQIVALVAGAARASHRQPTVKLS